MKKIQELSIEDRDRYLEEGMLDSGEDVIFDSDHLSDAYTLIHNLLSKNKDAKVYGTV